MNIDNIKQKVAMFLNTKIGVVLGLYLSMRLASIGVGSVLGGGGGVLLGIILLVGGYCAFNHFYEKISV